jgi:hypothetical protein
MNRRSFIKGLLVTELLSNVPLLSKIPDPEKELSNPPSPTKYKYPYTEKIQEIFYDFAEKYQHADLCYSNEIELRTNLRRLLENLNAERTIHDFLIIDRDIFNLPSNLAMNVFLSRIFIRPSVSLLYLRISMAFDPELTGIGYEFTRT